MGLPQLRQVKALDLHPLRGRPLPVRAGSLEAQEDRRQEGRDGGGLALAAQWIDCAIFQYPASNLPVVLDVGCPRSCALRAIMAPSATPPL